MVVWERSHTTMIQDNSKNGNRPTLKGVHFRLLHGGRGHGPAFMKTAWFVGAHPCVRPLTGRFCRQAPEYSDGLLGQVTLIRPTRLADDQLSRQEDVLRPDGAPFDQVEQQVDGSRPFVT